jgi:hypothetical protein
MSNPNPNPFDPANPLSKPTKITIKLSDTKAVVCPCGCDIFNQGLMLRKISVFLGGDDEPKPLPVIYCVKCFKPVPDFLPPDLRPVIDA